MISSHRQKQKKLHGRAIHRRWQPHLFKIINCKKYIRVCHLLFCAFTVHSSSTWRGIDFLQDKRWRNKMWCILCCTFLFWKKEPCSEWFCSSIEILELPVWIFWVSAVLYHQFLCTLHRSLGIQTERKQGTCALMSNVTAAVLSFHSVCMEYKVRSISWHVLHPLPSPTASEATPKGQGFSSS